MCIYIHTYTYTCVHTHTDKGGVTLIKVRVMASSTILISFRLLWSTSKDHGVLRRGAHLDNHYTIRYCILTLTLKVLFPQEI